MSRRSPRAPVHLDRVRMPRGMDSEAHRKTGVFEGRLPDPMDSGTMHAATSFAQEDRTRGGCGLPAEAFHFKNATK